LFKNQESSKRKYESDVEQTKKRINSVVSVADKDTTIYEYLDDDSNDSNSEDIYLNFLIAKVSNIVLKDNQIDYENFMVDSGAVVSVSNPEIA
jgi:hypothetical protein